MNVHLATLVAVGALSLSTTIGCNRHSGLEPKVASSAAESGYAARYPSELQSTVKNGSDGQSEAKKIFSGFSNYPNELSNPKWPVVKSVIERSDEAGRSHSYIQALKEDRSTRKFYKEEEQELARKVAGSAQYMVKQKGCDVDVSGAVSHALKDTMNKQLDKRLHAHNEAFAVIDKNRESLGKKNADTLENHADAIAYASYLVYVDLIEQQAESNRMLDEASQVRRTLDDAINDERAYQAEAGRTDAEKKASNERLTAYQKSRGELDAAISQAEQAKVDKEKQIEQLQKDYDTALEGLKKAVESKESK